MSRCWSDVPDARPDIRDVSSEVQMFFRECKLDTGRSELDNSSVEATYDGQHELGPKVVDKENESCIIKAISGLLGGLMRLAK
jgi:hypothetical protein